MRARAKQMRALAGLTELAFEARRLQFARLASEVEALQQGLADLDRPRTGSAPGVDPAARAGAEFRWRLWSETRKREIRAEIARLRAAMEAMHADMLRDHGRSQVARELAEKLARVRNSEG